MLHGGSWYRHTQGRRKKRRLCRPADRGLWRAPPVRSLLELAVNPLCRCTSRTSLAAEQPLRKAAVTLGEGLLGAQIDGTGATTKPK
jgi:hypothetical protein